MCMFVALEVLKFLWMDIPDENLRKIRWFGTFEETLRMGIQGLEIISIRSGHACGLGSSLPLISCIHVRSGPIYWGGGLFTL
jgi:hypothetical protein